MAGIGFPQIQYQLYIRRGDGVMRLVEKLSQRHVRIEALLPAAHSNGIFVRPRGGKGVYLMPGAEEGEIFYVDEFPEKVVSNA